MEARRDELKREYADIRRAHNEAINAIPDRADLRGGDGDLYGMDARREVAMRETAPAAEDQARVADELVEVAQSCVEWARGVLDWGDYSDGLDGMDREALTCVFDRALIRGDKAHAIAPAQLLDADGDQTAMPRLPANYDEIRVALDYLDAYHDSANVIPPALRMSTVRIPADERIRPSIDVARQIEREEAERRAAEDGARLEARQELHAELSSVPGAPTRLVSDESRARRAARRRRAPYGHGG